MIPPIPSTGQWNRGFIEGVETTVRAFLDAGVTEEQLNDVSRRLGLSVWGLERIESIVRMSNGLKQSTEQNNKGE
jgi:hypothetical protein